jgi:hypothetical protein
MPNAAYDRGSGTEPVEAAGRIGEQHRDQAEHPLAHTQQAQATSSP